MYVSEKIKQAAKDIPEEPTDEPASASFIEEQQFQYSRPREQNVMWGWVFQTKEPRPFVFRPPPMFAPAALSEDENEPSVFGQATKGTPTMLHTITDADCDALIDDPLGFLNKKMSAGQSAIAEEMRTIAEALRDKDFLDAMTTVTFATVDEE